MATDTIKKAEKPHFALSESLEYLGNVSSHPGVDQHQLGELVPGHLALRQQPPQHRQHDHHQQDHHQQDHHNDQHLSLPAEDENHQEYLLEYLAPLLWREGYVDVDVEDLLQSVLLKHLQSQNIRTTRITFSDSQPSS